jgi:DNA-binding SARP family transcriptional activator
VLQFRILGPLEVVGEDGPLRLGGPRQRATLAILLLNANRVVPVERLADDLYSGRPPVSAVTQVQRQVSELRQLLGSAEAIETRPPGYMLRLGEENFDLARFERLTAEAEKARARDDFASAGLLLGDALSLWRGSPLADVAHESFARAPVERLEELRLAALENRIDADLALGRHAALVAELEAVAAEHPLRERLRGQQMIALYRSDRQVEALAVYRDTRQQLVSSFGIEPSAALRALEQAILTHDSSLELGATRAGVPSAGAVLVAPSRDDRLDPLLELAGPLSGGRALLVARLVANERELAGATAAFEAFPPSTRTAAFTTDEPAADLVRLATTYEADLVLVDAPPGIDGEQVPDALAELLHRSPAQVAILAGEQPLGSGAIYVPFGGGEHDWAALELGAWFASSLAQPLRLVGTRADPRRGRRDASRLLADAALAVQQLVEVAASPLLVDPDERALVHAVVDGAVVVVGLSPRWPHEGIGAARRALVRGARPPVLLVHRGPRPSGLAPRQTRTRFTWTLGA